MASLLDHILTQAHEPGTYRADVSYLLSLVSAWSYADPETLSRVLKRPTLSGPNRPLAIRKRSVRNSAFPVDVNAYLLSFGEGPKTVHVLCFRGTELTNIIDLLTDALVEPHPWPGKREVPEWVHRGFFLSLDVLWPELVLELQELSGPLYATGHSLGGALAVMATRRFFDDQVTGPKLVGTYTYGQPMVGGSAFADAWPKEATLHRLVYKKDLVVRLPPRLAEDADADYQHFGKVYMPAQTGGWTELAPGSAAFVEASTACEGYDILPAFLTLITTRAPSLPTGILEFLANIPTAPQWLPKAPIRLLRGRSVVPETRCSLNDHVPTFYVDVSRAAWKAALRKG